MVRRKVTTAVKVPQRAAPIINTLPLEVQSLIAGFVSKLHDRLNSDERIRIADQLCQKVSHPTDLSCLSRTCKEWKAVTFPRLYACVKITVPHHLTDLDFLEHLLSSTGEGLRFTKSIKIQTVQKHCDNARLNDRYNPQDATAVSFPEDTWSENVNILIRLLIMKVPKNTIKEFM